MITVEEILQENRRRLDAIAAERAAGPATEFERWAAEKAYIKSKSGGEDILFRLNRPQRKLVTRLEAMRLAGRPIRLILLKARQWGGSTCVQLYMAWLQLTARTGLNSLLIAHQGSATDEIKDMFDRMIANYPGPEKWKMEGVGRSGSIFRIRERNCKIKVGTAERPDSCRGGDYSLVHCSEVAMWRQTRGKSPEAMVRSACSGVLLAPLTMIVFESTANGTGNYFHREYEAARRGESQFEPLFVAWYEIDQYSAPIADVRAFAAGLLAGREVTAAANERSEPGSYLWWLWERGATLEAINWYVMERSKYGDHGQMASEYPSDDVEAFVHSGARVFDRYAVERLRPGCRELMPEVGEIDLQSSDGRPMNAAAARDSERARMLPSTRFLPLASGAWRVWKHPRRLPAERYADRYVVAVDVGGRSAKSDWSVIAVFDRLPMLEGRGPEVVAQWRGHVDFDILAWKSAMAAWWYEEALLVIESNTLESRDPARDADGDQSLFLLNRLREVYANLYARPGSEEEVRRGAPARYGFHTNAATKPMVISGLVQVIREGLYTERDELTLDEYLSYERRQNGSFGAIAGAHDDLLMTRAIGLHICFELPLPRPAGVGTAARPRRPLGYAF